MTRANRKILKWAIAIILVIIISNISIVSFIIGVFTQTKFFYDNSYNYSSGNGKFQTSPGHLKGETTTALYKDLIKQFNLYKKKNPNDTILYRNFKINVLKFWFWREYLTEEHYHLPYKELPEKASCKN
ncbi:hypothetical protein SAMN04515674_11985 [Pseudarcicella hirudinis]|uniref:Uncharacterized protein n=1 Tax=Pseudarcicella hirudinis TaxID=1079859 RepID=A0A1I5YL60_9BACT|nr:hypothetical protein [Pseudarcicella hirudinis]SFQ44835.1 hypothetical protein SAMN04515674_11985 [Pseudarcicella hirudinis]